MADVNLTEGIPGVAQTFTVSLDRASAAQVTVRYTTTPSTALEPEDYSHTEGILTFAPGVVTATVPVAVAQDVLYEGTEAFAFVLSNATNARIGRATAVGRIVDDDSPPSLAVQAASLAEGSAGGAQLRFDLTLSDVSAVRASVDYATAAHSASEGGDYTATQGVAVFPPGTTTVSVNVPVVDDSIDEFDEQLRLQLSSASELVLASPFAVGTIVDDDPLPVLSISDAGISESEGSLSFAVRLSAPSGKPVAVRYASSNASATAGSDYAAAAGTLDFQPGEVEKTIAVPIVADLLFEGQETFLVTLSFVVHATLGQAVAVGTILDDDLPPTDPPADVTVSDINATEGDSGTASASFSVQLSESENAAVSIDWATVAGTAMASADFVGASGTLNFPPGTTTRSIDVDVVGDILDEDDETFRIVLSNPTGNVVLSDGSADAWIIDDDALPEISISDAGATEGDAGNPTLSLTVSLSAASGRAVAVSYATSDGSATAGLDFADVLGTLNFGPGETTRVITVPVLADALYETDETFEVSLASPGSATIADNLATATIQDDDVAPAISVGDVNVAEGNAGTVTLTFPLSLSGASALPASVTFTTSDLTATAGQDYVAASGTADFAPGQTAASVQVDVFGDVLIETQESFTLSLSNAVHASLADATAEGTILDDDGQPLLSLGDVSLTEGSSGTTTFSFPVQLSNPGPLDVSVDFSTSNGTAAAGSDYTATNGTLVIPAGMSSGLVEVEVNGDVIDEVDETFSLTLANSVNAGIDDGVAQGIIVDDDVAPALSITNAVLDESAAGGTALAFTVSLSAASSKVVTVNFASADGTASAGTDYLAAAGTLTFAASETSKLVQLTVLDDAVDEDSETLTINLANAQNASIGTGSGSGTITDDDTPPTLSISDASVTESDAGGAIVNLAVNLSAPSGRQVSVDFETSGGTALAGTDYVALAGTLTFNPGETARVVAVAVTSDLLHEADETFTVSLAAPVFATIDDGLGVATILDDDASPSISISDASIGEGNAGTVSLNFSLTLSSASGLPVAVNYATSDGTATQGQDYTSASGTVNFAAGETTQLVSVQINGDALHEIDEVLTVGLSNPVNAVLAVAQAQGTIVNDDSPPQISISDVTQLEGSGGSSTMSFTVQLSAQSALGVSVDFATSNGTAIAGSDYTATSGTLAVPAGATSGVVNVTISGDTTDEDNETFTLTLSNPVNAGMADGVAQGTITDDDAAPTLTISNAVFDELGGTGGAVLSFTVSLSAESGRPIAVHYSSSGGTALSDVDFTAVGGTLNLAPGVTSGLVAVPLLDDALDEDDETMQVTLSNAQNASIAVGIGTGTITDDDAPPSISIGNASIVEGDAGTATLNVSLGLSGMSGRAVAVNFATSNGTALAGQDYASTTGTVNFAAGETAKLISVSINGDTLYEADETFAVGLSNPVNAVLAVTSAEGSITNDDSPPSLSIADLTQLEGSAGPGSMSFTVQLSVVSGLDVDVDYSTGNGTAAAGSDYTVASGTLAIPAGATSGVVNVTINGDAIDEDNETFSVSLANPVNAGLADAAALGSITDDDAPPTVTISDAVLDEAGAGGAALSFSVSLSAVSGRAISVDYSSAGGTAQSGDDFTAVSGTLNFAPGDTSKAVAVAVLDDALDEEDEQLQVTLANAQNASIAVGVATGTITDDDALPSISIGNASIVEGNSGTSTLNFSLSLNGASGRAVAVNFATANGTAFAGQDYTSTSGTVTFAAGESAKLVGVSIIGENVHEGDEIFTVGLSNPVNAVLAVTSAEGSIANDDSPPLLSVADVTQNEGSAGTSTMNFAVQLAAPSGLDVNVGFSTSDGTAAAGSDYTASSGTLTILAGTTSGVIGVTIVGDTLDEVNESFSLTLANPVNADVADGVAQGTITDDDAQPSFSISAASVTEGTSGTVNLSFPVTLSAASGRETRVNYASASGSAQSGLDFTAVSGTLTYTPGQTSKQVTVTVLHDTLDEHDETMQMTLSNPQSASISVGIGTGTITDNDAEPSLTISDATVTEGDSGAAALTFTLALSAASGKEIDVSYATQDGSATAGEDYLTQADVLTFNPGVTSFDLVVDVLGDLDEEGDETLLVDLSDGVNVIIADASATGTITNDDGVVSWGLDSRPSNLTCIAPERPELNATIDIGNPFPNLPPIQQPLALAQPPGDNTKWFVIEQPGRVRTFANSPAANAINTVIDIRTEVDDSDQEMGLLGMAFHPEYSTPGSPHEGELFLAYTAAGPTSRVTRFKTTNNWASFTQEVIIEAERDFTNHNGGNIAFGPDGYLYIGWGDGGGSGDPFGRAQDTTDLLGAMLRIDVDGGTPYAIPPDNPFAGNPVCPADHSSLTPCPEIYAWGFRNPWRWSFDSATGELWLGDVGEDSWEEIDRVELGGNYGWDVREGAHCHEPSSGCSTAGLIDPVHEYDFGQAVLGGFVYRGLAIPDLFGSYLFADTYSGTIWMLENDGQGGYSTDELVDTDAFMTSFAQGNDGELYLLDAGTGTILSIVAGSGGGSPDTIPDLLSETGCFDPADPTIPAGGLIPYSINAPFWSDGADKDRYLAIPDGTTITVGGNDDWTFPPGSVIVKNFSLGDELFETRLLMRHPDGVWAGYTYEWNEDGSDATRVIGGKTKLIDGQPWIYPSEGQCANCHTLAAGFTLGLESAQLNRDFTYESTGRTANQLVTLDHIALFGAALPNVPNAQPRLADPANTAETLDARARAYLYTNCAQCHRPLGPAPSNMDFRYQTALTGTNACNIVPQHGDLGIGPAARLIAPGAAANSIVINRMSRRDTHGMPPLASNFVDVQGAALVAAWINDLSSCL